MGKTCSIFGMGLLFILLMSFVSSGVKGDFHTLTVKITHIRSNKGRIQLQIYKDFASYKAEEPWKTKYIDKSDVNGGELVYSIPWLETDVYGIAILDDENKNAEMDYSWLVPTEGFAFSDYYHTAWSKPNFNHFKFELNSNKTVVCKVRYL